MQLIQRWNIYNCLPPSVNHMYGQVSRKGAQGRFMTKEYKDFIAIAKPQVALYQPEFYEQYRDSHLCLEVKMFWSGWYTKDGKLWTNRDCSNRYKAIEDLIFRQIGIDDSRNVCPMASKLKPLPDEPEKHMQVSLYLLDAKGNVA